MENLPTKRIIAARPFMNSGVDFFGPVWTHYKLRGKRPHKSYVAVFCCFATKAVHFEVVTDLSTEAFIGALRRFTGRRGNCRNLYCDNATNFVGAKNRLNELKDSIYGEKAQEQITKFCVSKGTDFHFIPPRAPHFGGLWEAAVKSAKHLLQPSIGGASLTYEELETLMVEIEAILNSRPLTPLSTDPNDLEALTPGHFLIGEPPTTVVDPNVQPIKIGILQRWKQASQLKNQFWQRWSKEYLNELQYRYKWKQECQNAKPGMMVVIKEENLPSASWQLGRIEKIIKGDDGLVRVADVRTSNGILRRAIHKLAPLPVDTTVKPEDRILNDYENKDNGPDTSRKRRGPNENSNLSAKDQIQQRSSEHQGTTKSKKARSSYSVLSIALVACLIMPILGQVHIKPFPTPPGVYFENMGDAHIVSNDWNIVVYYNTSFMWDEIKQIKNGIENLNRICEYIQENKTCQDTIFQFSKVMIELKSNNEVLFHKVKNSPRRRKRGALNIIGNVANSLFGVLDSNYAERMSGVIKNLQADDKYLLELIKNQTTIIDATVNLVRKTEEDTTIKMQNIHKYINQTIVAMKNIDRQQRYQKSAQAFTTLTLQLLLILNNYQKIQSTLLDLMIDTHHGKVNPQLITPKQLTEQLITVQKHLPATLRLPAHSDNLLKLYNLMSIEGHVADDRIIFRLKLPLFSHERFELLRVIPVPFFINNTFMTLGPLTEYLVINLHRDQYYPLSEPELRKCVISESEFICKQHHPLFSKGSHVCACEISVISHWPWKPSCQARIISEPPHWIQLLNPNHWIFAMAKKTTINIVCGNKVTSQPLEGSGIIKLNADCAIRDEMMTILGHNVYSSRIKSAFTPSKLLSEFTNLSIPIKLSSPDIIHNINKDIQDIQAKIETLKTKENQFTTLENHNIHHYTVSYLSLLLVIIIGFLLLWKYLRTKTNRKNNVTQDVIELESTTHFQPKFQFPTKT